MSSLSDMYPFINDQGTDVNQEYQYLQDQNAVPELKVFPFSRYGQTYAGASGAFRPDLNELHMNSEMPELAKPTATHELNHGVLHAIQRQSIAQPDNVQLADGYRKIMEPTKIPISYAADDPYRAQPNEYLSFGVGNMSTPMKQSELGYPAQKPYAGFLQPSTHADANAAQEMAVLRELAMNRRPPTPVERPVPTGSIKWMAKQLSDYFR